MNKGTDTTTRDTAALDEFLTAEQAAERIGLDGENGPRILRMVTETAYGPDTMTIGGRTVYPARALDEWLRWYSIRDHVENAASWLEHTVRPPFPEGTDGDDDRTINHGESDECADWCQHRSPERVAEQMQGEPCFGADQRIEMSLMPAPGKGDLPNHADLLAYRGVGGPDIVMMQYNDGDELRFTPDEFEAFLRAGHWVLGMVQSKHISERERARQEGYDAGYADALSLGQHLRLVSGAAQ